MHRTRRRDPAHSATLPTVVVTLAVMVGLTSVVAVAQTAIDRTPPPRIAFVAHAFNPADALAVGPIAGQLGAPLFTTAPASLSPEAAAGLAAYEPDLVLVAGGPGAIAEAVLDQIREATGLAGEAVDRVFGQDRTGTARELAFLLSERGFNAAFLAIDGTAVHADGATTANRATTADRAETAGHATTAGDADTVGGHGPEAFVPVDGSRPMTGALEAPAVVYTTPRQYQLRLTGRAFVGGCTMVYDEPSVRCSTGSTTIGARVQLPNHAVITAVSFLLVDAHPTTSLRAWLTSNNQAVTGVEHVSSGGGTSSSATIPLPDGGRVMGTGSFEVRAQPVGGNWGSGAGNAISVSSITIHYELPEAP